jgi:hypothetical protein
MLVYGHYFLNKSVPSAFSCVQLTAQYVVFDLG